MKIVFVKRLSREAVKNQEDYLINCSGEVCKRFTDERGDHIINDSVFMNWEIKDDERNEGMDNPFGLENLEQLKTVVAIIWKNLKRLLKKKGITKIEWRHFYYDDFSDVFIIYLPGIEIGEENERVFRKEMLKQEVVVSFKRKGEDFDFPEIKID